MNDDTVDTPQKVEDEVEASQPAKPAAAATAEALAGAVATPAAVSAAVSAAPLENAAPRAPTVAEGGKPVEGSTLSEEELGQLTADVIAALKTVYDPEIPSDIYELGLIYKIDIADSREVSIDMTLTAPGCPVAGEMPSWVENAVNAVPGISGTKVQIVFDPPWEMSRMSDEAKLAVGMF